MRAGDSKKLNKLKNVNGEDLGMVYIADHLLEKGYKFKYALVQGMLHRHTSVLLVLLVYSIA